MKKNTPKSKSVKYNSEFNMLELLNKTSNYKEEIQIPIESDVGGNKATILITSKPLDQNDLDALLLVLYLCTLKDKRLLLNKEKSSKEAKALYDQVLGGKNHPDAILDTIAVKPTLADLVNLSGKSKTKSTRDKFKQSLKNLSKISFEYYGDLEMYSSLIRASYNPETHEFIVVIHPRIAASILGSNSFQYIDLASHLSLKRDRISKNANYFFSINTSQKKLGKAATRYEQIQIKLNTLLGKIDHKFTSIELHKDGKSFRDYRNNQRSEFLKFKLPKLIGIGWNITIEVARDGDHLLVVKRPESFSCL